MKSTTSMLINPNVGIYAGGYTHDRLRLQYVGQFKNSYSNRFKAINQRTRYFFWWRNRIWKFHDMVLFSDGPGRKREDKLRQSVEKVWGYSRLPLVTPCTISSPLTHLLSDHFLPQIFMTDPQRALSSQKVIQYLLFFLTVYIYFTF